MFKVMKRECPMFGDGPYVCEFLCDTASDVSTLPTSTSEGTGGKSAYDNQTCASGSIATIADNGSGSKWYMLNNQDVWCPNEIGTGSSYELPIATTDTLGGVMVDGTSITADENGVIRAVDSSGGMELIGSYAFTYSGTAESTTSASSDYIQILPEIPEKNRTFLIYAKMTINETTKYNYSCIVKMFGNTADNTSNIVRLKFGDSTGHEPDLYLVTKPSQDGYGLKTFLNNRVDFLKSGYFSIDIYDMGVIE